MDVWKLRATVLAAAGVVAGPAACGPASGMGMSASGSAGATGGDTDASAGTTTAASTTDPGSSGPATSVTGDDCPVNVYTMEQCYGPPGGFGTGSTGGGDTGTGGTGSGSTGSGGAGSTGDTGGVCPADPPWTPSDCGLWTSGWSESYLKDGECCFELTIENTCCGRPYVVDGLPRVASATPRDDWTTPVRVRPVDAAVASRLSAAWLADAADEHAATAAFSRFVLDLISMGAPAGLVEEAQRAVGDEIRHARVCYGLAGAYGGEPVGPGRLDVRDPGTRDALAIVLSAVAEGCIGETLAAAQACVARDAATDPAVKAALDIIAEDEARHAALAWRFVRWALGRHPELIGHVRRRFRDALHGVVTLPASARGVDETLRSHGRLPPTELAALYERTVDEVIRPAAAAVCPTPAAHAATSSRPWPP